MKSDYSKWVSATANLKARRKETARRSDNPTYQNPVSDYRLHLIKCGYGASVLDIGCGAQFLKTQLAERTHYIPIDAFPADGYEHITLPIAIESDEALELSADTVCAFAVLDNCLDFDKACSNMKKIAKKNIIILTGINIPVDEFHTFCLQHSDFERCFSDWRCTHREEIAPKVFLLNYEK